MGRKLRAIEDGLVYHIVNRGNDKSYIFNNDSDKMSFIECLVKAKKKYNYMLLAYAIMDNHYHLLIKTTESGTISQIMHHIHCGYSRYYKKSYNKTGHIFGGRYKDKVIDNDSYLLQVSKYIHLNPCEAGIIDLPHNYKYSSLRYILDDNNNYLLDKEFILRVISNNIIVSKDIYIKSILDDMSVNTNDILLN